MPQCAVCGKTLAEQLMEEEIERDGETYYVCCPNCQDDFQESPEQYA
ncbi:YHS domain-containing protein [Halomarina halobia]|uniref:YHS domain-containing protein n=1 Tax=Halomarina halobia TaxID=3033386 RepID=A0ABD6AA78_9EURY|nr:YHS domain-containing protein [Halomarina sp. PSR21]